MSRNGVNPRTGHLRREGSRALRVTVLHVVLFTGIAAWYVATYHTPLAWSDGDPVWMGDGVVAWERAGRAFGKSEPVRRVLMSRPAGGGAVTQRELPEANPMRPPGGIAYSPQEMALYLNTHSNVLRYEAGRLVAVATPLACPAAPGLLLVAAGTERVFIAGRCPGLPIASADDGRLVIECVSPRGGTVRHQLPVACRRVVALWEDGGGLSVLAERSRPLGGCCIISLPSDCAGAIVTPVGALEGRVVYDARFVSSSEVVTLSREAAEDDGDCFWERIDLSSRAVTAVTLLPRGSGWGPYHLSPDGTKVAAWRTPHSSTGPEVICSQSMPGGAGAELRGESED